MGKLLDSTSQTGLTLVQQQMERLLYKAKNQLKQSKSMRDGQNEYQKNLSGGTRFAKQIRQKLRKINDRSDQKLVSREQEKAEHLPEFFYQKFSSTSIDSLPIFPSQPQAMSNASMPNLGDWKSKSMPNLGDNLRLQGQASQKPSSRARPGNTRTTAAGSLEGGDRRRHKTLLSPIQLQDLRHKLCGHFPAYYDLPRMLSILGEQETQVKSMLADEMKHMQAYGGQTAPAGGLGAMGRDQAMLAAMNDKNSLVQELKSEDETMIWNINYKE